MTRIAIDHDADGAYAVITRPGQAAERVQLTHRSLARLAAAAMEAWLDLDRRRQAKRPLHHHDHGDDPPHFIGALGE